MKTIGAILVCLLLAGCASPVTTLADINTATLVATATITITPKPTATSSVTPTPTNSATPTATNTPKPTATRTPVPTELAGQILRVYTTVNIIQTNTHLLNEAARRVRDGQLSGFKEVAVIAALGGFVSAANEAITQTVVPGPLANSWQSAITVHQNTLITFRAWLNQDIKSPQVVTDTLPLLVAADAAAAEMDNVLVATYGFDRQDVDNQRQKILLAIPGIFATATATAKPPN